MGNGPGAQQAPPGWYPDPTSRHQMRYFDGSVWSEHVTDEGRQTSDPLVPSPRPTDLQQGTPSAPPPRPIAASDPAPKPGSPPTSSAPVVGKVTHTPPGGVTMGEAVRRCLTKYVDFTGRAPRSEYWWYLLALWLAFFAAVIVGGIFAGPEGAEVLPGVIFYGGLLPWLAVNARRLHDIGRSGWWMLIGLIPFVGPIIMIIWAATEGSRQPNEWGPPVSY